MESSGEACGVNPSSPLLPGPLWPGMVVPIWVPSKGQIDLFENY